MNLFQQHLSLSQLNRMVKRALRTLSMQGFWVIAEIADIKQAASGHVYMELVEKSGNRMVAKLQAVIWANTFLNIRQQFGSDTRLLLKKGNKVLIKGKVDFHEVYGIKITISELDPSVTLGELERQRLATVRKLREAQLIGLNNLRSLPSVLQNVAVISSATAAGYGDFVSHLARNAYGYKVNHRLFPAAMQGDNTEADVVAQLAAIGQQTNDFDVVVLIRGGGSKLDLHAFNNFEIGAAIAQCPLPVLSGIGHQQDETVPDLVAHTSLKTPTAVAEFIIDSFVTFEENLVGIQAYLHTSTQQILNRQELTIRDLNTRFRLSATHFTRRENEKLANHEQVLTRLSQHLLKQEHQRIAYLESTFKLFNIENLLRRGFSITRHQGKVISNADALKKGDMVVTELAQGTLKSEIL